jgi:hypothetical protein
MRERFRSPIIKASAHHLEKTEESSLYRQPMSDRQWQESLAVLNTRMDLLDQNLVQEATGALRAAYDWLEPIMERYCEITCPACTDFCCQATRVFFNHTDLLTILALGLTPPPGQTRSGAAEPCRYLTPAGCSLKRTVRPYVCVWYLCEAQMALYREEPAKTQRRFVATLESIRANRLRIESHYESLFLPQFR